MAVRAEDLAPKDLLFSAGLEWVKERTDGPWILARVTGAIIPRRGAL